MVDEARRRKWLQYGVAAAAIGIPFTALAIWLAPNDKPARTASSDQKAVMDIANLTDGGRESDLWMAKASGRLDYLQDQLEARQSERDREVKELQAQLSALKDELTERTQNAIAAIDAQEEENTRLREELAARTRAPQAQPGEQRLTVPVAPSYPDGDFVQRAGQGTPADFRAPANGQFQATARVPQKISLALEGSETEIKTFSTESYVPAGSYANAMVIQGVEASVGISAAADPRPVLLRITGKAVSAAREGEQELVDLSGCLVTGAARGDLSSEKVYIRLINMTCTRETGRVFEVEVKGYVSAQGSAGIRGPVISREGEFTQKAFTAGLFSGFGGAARDLSRPNRMLTGIGAVEDNPSLMDIFGQGVGSGVSEAGNLLSRYYIDRAEQYQPVVVTRPGTQVDIVFEEGINLARS